MLVLGIFAPTGRARRGTRVVKKKPEARVLAGPESADATRERRPYRARRRALVRSRSPGAGSGVSRAR